MIKNLDQLLELAKSAAPKRVAVACAQDIAALDAAVEAAKMQLARSILVGDQAKIQPLLKNAGGNANDWLEIVHEPDDTAATRRAVQLARDGKADILLKGACKTSTLLKAVLDKERGIGLGRLLSDVFMFEDKLRGQLVVITDGGVVLKPTLDQKIAIIQNAVSVCHALGNNAPKVALLSAVETVIPEIQATVEADTIARMNREGKIIGCIIEGPISLDLAISAESVRIKGYKSPVGGNADILVPPEIIAANLLAKGITYYGDVRLAHVIIGARVPILIPSRADSADAKLMSIALGIAAQPRAVSVAG